MRAGGREGEARGACGALIRADIKPRQGGEEASDDIHPVADRLTPITRMRLGPCNKAGASRPRRGSGKYL